MAERLVFDLLANDLASKGFAAAGHSASVAADDVAKLALRLDDVSKKSATARVGLEGNQKATDELNKLALKLLAVGKIVANPDIELHGAVKAALEIQALNADLERLGKQVKKTGFLASLDRGFQGVAFAALSALPALGSMGVIIGGLAVIAAAAAVALGPLIAGLAVIGAAFTGLAAIAIPMITKVIAARTKLAAAEQKYDLATTKAQRASALKAEAAATAGLTSGQKALLGPLGQLSAMWGQLNKQVQPEILHMFGEALKVIKDIMPVLAPLIDEAATALAGFFENVDKWLRSSSGKKFLHWLEIQGVKDVGEFGKALWSFARGAGQALHFLVDAGTTLDNRLKERWASIKHGAADLVQWFWRDFTLKIINFFVHSIPNAGSIMSGILHGIWNDIEIAALSAVSGILGAFSHIPLIGGQFAKARDAIGRELGRIEADSNRTWARVQADMAGLHGKTVDVAFKLTGTTIVGKSPGGIHITGHAAGTPGAAPGLAWVGERGPELVNFHGGETVFNHHQSRRMAGYASGTLDSFTGRFPSAKFVDRASGAMQAVIDRIAASLQRLYGVIAAPGFGGHAGPGGGAPAANAALARSMFPGENFGAWNYVAMRESGWNQFARNPSSGAYGIPQALPESKLPFAGQAAGGSNPAAQISWMEGYMRSRYGGAGGAAAHELAFNWYDRGGWLPKGLSLALNTTGRPERVSSGGGQHVVLEFRGGGHGALERALISWICQTVHVRGGGSVEAAFGS